jgi:hypothetical protein
MVAPAAQREQAAKAANGVGPGRGALRSLPLYLSDSSKPALEMEPSRWVSIGSERLERVAGLGTGAGTDWEDGAGDAFCARAGNGPKSARPANSATLQVSKLGRS